MVMNLKRLATLLCLFVFFSQWVKEDDIIFFDIILHIGRKAVEIEELDFKGEIAFNKNIVELRQYFMGGLFITENSKVEVGGGTVRAFDTRAKDPDGGCGYI